MKIKKKSQKRLLTHFGPIRRFKQALIFQSIGGAFRRVVFPQSGDSGRNKEKRF
jgi:hypothetical protein